MSKKFRILNWNLKFVKEMNRNSFVVKIDEIGWNILFHIICYHGILLMTIECCINGNFSLISSNSAKMTVHFCKMTAHFCQILVQIEWWVGKRIFLSQKAYWHHLISMQSDQIFDKTLNETFLLKIGPFPVSFSDFIFHQFSNTNSTLSCNHLFSCHTAISTTLMISSTRELSYPES